MKEYKPVGQFYQDAATLCNLFGLKLHPIFREPAPGAPEGDGEVNMEEGKKAKEPTTITISKYRIDPNSLKVLFKVLETCPHIQTLK